MKVKSKKLNFQKTSSVKFITRKVKIINGIKLLRKTELLRSSITYFILLFLGHDNKVTGVKFSNSNPNLLYSSSHDKSVKWVHIIFLLNFTSTNCPCLMNFKIPPWKIIIISGAGISDQVLWNLCRNLVVRSIFQLFSPFLRQNFKERWYRILKLDTNYVIFIKS